MRKSRRIEILKQQIEKLNDEKYEKDEKWTIQTLTYINRFFGENSPQSKYIKEFKFQGYIEYPYTKEDQEKDKIKQINDAKRFLHDCIEVINNDVAVLKKHNFLERFGNNVVIPIITAAIPGLLTVGYIFGVSTTDSKNIELRQENKALIKEKSILKDSLNTVRTTFKIPNNIPK